MPILDHRGNPVRSARPLPVRAKYDAAQTTDENRRHWTWADSLSARAANDPEVRRKLRERARYEVANNSYAAGIVSTLANDLIGPGPRLQLQSENDGINRQVEAAFNDWTRAVCLPSKLRTLRRARAADGEAFALLGTNPRLPDSVKLDVRLVEADQVATPYAYPIDAYAVDGIRFDREWNPIEYHLLDWHPGDTLAYGFATEYTPLPPSQVIHWFRADRPQQYRGVPELTPALTLFAQLRRYTLAVLAAAETAADFAALLESELPPDSDEDEITPFTSTQIERRMMTTLPSGYKLSQLKAEQPTTTYEMFKRELLNEIARSLNVPYNVAAGNSSSYNYASGRLDHQVYHRTLAVDQSDLESVALDRIFDAWLAEAERVYPWLPAGMRWPRRWLWPGLEHVDPEKEANATETRLRTFTTTFSDECHRQGVDPQERVQQIAADVKMFAAAGLPSPYQQQPATQAGNPGATPNGQQQDQGDGEDARGRLVHRNGHIRP